MLKTVLKQFGFDEADCIIQQFGSGLINSTWLIKHEQKKYILQRINHDVFLHPEDIAFNIRLTGNYLQEHSPQYLFVHPCLSIDGEDMIKVWESYFRMFPFIEGSHTVNTVANREQAYEAAKQFARFTKLLSGLDAANLKITLPDFHNLALRYRQFENALETGNKARIGQSKDLIKVVKQNRTIVDQYEICKKDLKIRCTHHDTKISNVLFDQAGKGLCVIDLDTVMPGYFISDVGDMMRTYLCPVSEEEKDLSKIMVRTEFYDAIVNGYLSEMGVELSEKEIQYFHYAGIFMIYMQALRFLTDHINDDAYYGAKYEGHNFIRAANQITLLQQLQLLK
ncbi:MAG: aminoglycoside phosphotransferase family protein [Ferruginibacter sp.]